MKVLVRSSFAAFLAGACDCASAQPSGPGVIDASGMVLSLAAVVALILVGAVVLKRTPLGFAGRGEGPLKLVATLPLGPKERLLLIDARGREMLVAVSPAGIAIADAARPQTEPASTSNEVPAEVTPIESFAKRLAAEADS